MDRDLAVRTATIALIAVTSVLWGCRQDACEELPAQAQIDVRLDGLSADLVTWIFDFWRKSVHLHALAGCASQIP